MPSKTNKQKIQEIKKDLDFLSKCINNKLFVQSLRDHMDEIFDDLNCRSNIRPKNKLTKYIGLELEFYSRKHRCDIIRSLIKNNLHHISNVCTDGSIDVPTFSYNDHELRLLLKEKSFSQDLKKLKKVLIESEAKVNESCGLHIHIDMRNRNYDRCFNNLYHIQGIMKKLVARHRLHNDMCKLGYPEDPFDRHYAINPASIRRHQTIEIRLHEATTNVKKIECWIKFLLKVVNSRKELPKIDKKSDFTKYFKVTKDLDNYLKRAE